MAKSGTRAWRVPKPAFCATNHRKPRLLLTLVAFPAADHDLPQSEPDGPTATIDNTEISREQETRSGNIEMRMRKRFAMPKFICSNSRYKSSARNRHTCSGFSFLSPGSCPLWGPSRCRHFLRLCSMAKIFTSQRTGALLPFSRELGHMDI